MTKIIKVNAATGETITRDMTAEEQAEFDARQVSVSTPVEEKDYISKRRNAYPEIGDQLDMLWHTMDKDNELQHKFYDFYQTIKKVKVSFPKK